MLQAQLVHRFLQPLLAAAGLLAVIQQAELLVHLLIRDHPRAGDGEGANGGAGPPMGMDQFHGRPVQFPLQPGGPGQGGLPGDGLEGRVLDVYLHRAALEAVAAQAKGHLVGEGPHAAAYFLLGEQVPPEGHAVAHRLHRLRLDVLLHRLLVQAPGVVPQHFPALAQPPGGFFPVHTGQVADGVYPVALQGLTGGSAHEQQRRNRQGPYLVPVVFPADYRYCVGLFHVAA